MSAPTTTDVLQELKAGQESIAQTQQLILQRLEKLKENHVVVSSEVTSLIHSQKEFKEDFARKFEALNLAVHYPASVRLTRTPELLELILGHLPTKDLFLAQGVNRYFKEVIDVQRLLFFVPAPIEAQAKPVLNPVLLSNSNKKQPRSMLVIFSDTLTNLLNFGVTKVVDRDWATPEIRGVVPGVAVETDLEVVYDLYNRYDRPLTQAKCYATGSWRRMYLTQPPCGVEWHVRVGLQTGTVKEVTTCGELWVNRPNLRYTCVDKEPATLEEYAEYLGAAHKEGLALRRAREQEGSVASRLKRRRTRK